MKIAIIGAGVSGLVTAHRLSKEHQVTIFEANSYAGGHINTVDIETAGQKIAVDTGFIVFNDWTYRNFVKLLAELGVKSRPAPMTFSVRDDRCGLEYNGHSLNTLFAQRRNLWRLSFYRMLADILRFNQAAQRTRLSCDDKMTVGDFIRSQGFSRAFAEHYLLPMGSAIWSCPAGRFADFPIQFIAEFYRNHGLLNLWHRPTWRTIEGGSQVYVRALLNRFKGRVLLNCPVFQVRRQPETVHVYSRDVREAFDHVIFACHSDQALRMLDNTATPQEREVLSAFAYQKNVALLHTDTSLLPRRRRAWASWNYRIVNDAPAAAMVTYNMNLLQGFRSPRTVCVTLNGESHINRRSVLRRFEYEHPVFTTQRNQAQARHAELLDVNRTSYCGAYWGNGFHEDGVVSALAVVDALGRRCYRGEAVSASPVQSVVKGSRVSSLPALGGFA